MTATYIGSTSTAPNPPVLLNEVFSGHLENSPSAKGARLWFYASSNVVQDLTSTGVITDGFSIGMRVGDILVGSSPGPNSSSPIAFLGIIGTQCSGSTIVPGLNSSGVSLSSNYLSSTMVSSG